MRVRWALMVFLAVLFCGSLCAFGQRKVIQPEGLDLGLPFSPAFRVDGVLYVSGTVGTKPGEKRMADGIEAQTRQALENIGAILSAANMTFENVVSSTVYLSDIRHFSEMNNVYREYFRVSPPARATVEGGIVLPGGLVEIAVVAVDSSVSRKIVVPSGWSQPSSPYSWGVVAGDTLYVAGMVGTEVETGRRGATFKAQTEQTFKNIEQVLKAAGYGFKDVVSTRVYLSDARDFSAMNEVFREVFPRDPPARATVQARLANPELAIEVQCVAVKSEERKIVGDRPETSPFSPAVAVGDTLYLSGMVGRSVTGFVPGDVKAQTEATLENLRTTMEKAGFTFQDVVDVSVFLSDVRHYAGMNDVYRQRMPNPPPPRATVQTLLMSPEALIEIMLTARRTVNSH